MAEKVYLIDGMSHIYRAYHAIQGLSNEVGLRTNAIYGFTNMLRKLIREETPGYVGVAIDLSGPTVRHEQYKGYKATRRPMPEDLAEQIPYILQVCQVLRIPVLSFQGYEADDVIGTLAVQAVAQGLEVVIVTIDKDMFQLVSDRISILDTRTITRLNPQKVAEKFGVKPEQVVDVLSLMGDSSDNIPGAPGIGEKGARQLIQAYGSLDNLLAHSEEVSRKTYRESLQKNGELIRQSQHLLTIYKDLPLQLNLQDLRLSEPDHEAAQNLFTQLEFTSLLKEFLPARKAPRIKYSSLEGAPELQKLACRLEGKRAALALDFSESYLEGPLRGISISVDSQEVFYLSQKVLESREKQVALLLEKPRQWVVHDLKPLYFFAGRRRWVIDQECLDSMLMAYLMTPNENNFSLEFLGQKYLQHGIRQRQGEKDKLSKSEQIDAFCERAVVTLQLSEVLNSHLQEKNLDRLLREIELPLVQVLAAMEKQGVKVDCNCLRAMSQQMEQEVGLLTRRIYDLAGEEFNINSPRQLANVLFEKLNLPLAKKTRKAGHYATGMAVLDELAESYEIARLILDYRELSKLKNTYLDIFPQLVNAGTGRIHTCYNQMVAATGRLSSSNPNLQNIPIKSKLGRKIRRAFITEPGYQILAADYSQIELRVMAHLSGDQALITSFCRGEDIHGRTGREVFGNTTVMDPHELRRRAKAINFGIMYGLSAFGLAQSLKIDRQQAQDFIDHYFLKYRGVKNWIDHTLQLAREKGYVRTLLGRIRQIPEIHSRNWNLRNFGERTAINAPIQGTAADLIKKAMVTIYQEMLDRKLQSKMIMQVHDELVFEVEDSEVELMKFLVREKMEHAADLLVPLSVDLAVGKSWFEAK